MQSNSAFPTQQTPRSVPRPSPLGWDGVERRSGGDRRSGKDRRNTVHHLLQGFYHWMLGKPNHRAGEDRRQTVKDRRSRLRPY